MEHPKVDVFALAAYPHAHWTRIWSPSSREIRRRERVGSSAKPAAVVLLVGAVLADMHDERQAGDRRTGRPAGLTGSDRWRTGGATFDLVLVAGCRVVLLHHDGGGLSGGPAGRQPPGE
jgi:hypothetical protein